VREISEKQCAVLKAAPARAMKLAGGAAVVQHSTRVNEATLSKYASTSPDNDKNFVPVDVAVEIDMLAQSPIIVGAMAEMLGYRLVPNEDAAAEARPLTVHDALVIANEAADVVKAITEALANDGEIDAAEDRIITREVDELVRVLKNTLRNVSVRRGRGLKIIGEAV
jgi:hypothetical protein